MISSNVPSPRLRKRRAGPNASVTKRSGKPSPSTSPAATPVAAMPFPSGPRSPARSVTSVKRPVPVVPVEDRAHAVGDEEVLEAVAVEVEDGDAGARARCRRSAGSSASAADCAGARPRPASAVASWKRGRRVRPLFRRAQLRDREVNPNRFLFLFFHGRRGRHPLCGDDRRGGALDASAVGAKSVDRECRRGRRFARGPGRRRATAFRRDTRPRRSGRDPSTPRHAAARFRRDRLDADRGSSALASSPRLRRASARGGASRERNRSAGARSRRFRTARRRPRAEGGRRERGSDASRAVIVLERLPTRVRLPPAPSFPPARMRATSARRPRSSRPIRFRPDKSSIRRRGRSRARASRPRP